MLRQVVAEALEKNSVVTSVTVDPADDRIDDQGAKAWWVSFRHLCSSLFPKGGYVMRGNVNGL